MLTPQRRPPGEEPDKLATGAAAASGTLQGGPEVEIEYWTRRMPTLISVTEQLKSRRNRVVTGVLKVRAQMDDDGVEAADDKKARGAGLRGPGGGWWAREQPPVADARRLQDGGHHTVQEQVKELLERWREVDMMITDALNEAKDNVRFLSACSGRVARPLARPLIGFLLQATCARSWSRCTTTAPP